MSKVQHITGWKTSCNWSRPVFSVLQFFNKHHNWQPQKNQNLCNHNWWSGLLQLGSVQLWSFFQSSKLDLWTLVDQTSLCFLMSLFHVDEEVPCPDYTRSISSSFHTTSCYTHSMTSHSHLAFNASPLDILQLAKSQNQCTEQTLEDEFEAYLLDSQPFTSSIQYWQASSSTQTLSWLV